MSHGGEDKDSLKQDLKNEDGNIIISNNITHDVKSD